MTSCIHFDTTSTDFSKSSPKKMSNIRPRIQLPKILSVGKVFNVRADLWLCTLDTNLVTPWMTQRKIFVAIRTSVFDYEFCIVELYSNSKTHNSNVFILIPVLRMIGYCSLMKRCLPKKHTADAGRSKPSSVCSTNGIGLSPVSIRCSIHSNYLFIF
jgi:hypothetical protein